MSFDHYFRKEKDLHDRLGETSRNLSSGKQNVKIS